MDQAHPDKTSWVCNIGNISCENCFLVDFVSVSRSNGGRVFPQKTPMGKAINAFAFHIAVKKHHESNGMALLRR